MKINHLYLGIALLAVPSCGAPTYTYLESYSPEESGLNVMKITDENQSIIGGQGTTYAYSSISHQGICTENGIGWNTLNLLDVSPDGTELAYESFTDGQWNIMIRKSGPQGSATQRTYRNVDDFSWGADGNLYFGDASDTKRIQVSATDAHVGSIMRQLTSNNKDQNPVLSKDGKKIFFTRVDNSGSFIWSYDLENGALTSCCRGYNPCPIGEGSDEFLCVRNSSMGSSEIWRVNYEKGIETLILSDKNRGFSNPRISPDGTRILCEGSSISSISKKPNLDIFVVNMDGTNLIQLTYHPANDCCPVWSPDGKYIYFLSSRANEKSSFNIWRIRFDI